MSSPSLPWGDKPIRELPYMVLDLETTGLYPNAADILEVALVPLNSEEPILDTLIDPEKPIPSEITKLTGIKDGDVRGKPKIHELMPVLQAYLETGIFVSHNVPFDWGFLDQAYRRHAGKPLNCPNLCTLELSRRLLMLHKNALGFVAAHFQIPLVNAHRAMADTVAVKEILLRFFDVLEKRGCKTANDLVQEGYLRLNPPSRSR